MTTENRTPAGRCIAFIRPHRWTHWRVQQAKAPFGVSLAIVFQSRECLRCGRTQRTAVGAS